MKRALLSMLVFTIVAPAVFAAAEADARNQVAREKRLVTPLLDFETAEEVGRFEIRKTNPPTVFQRNTEHATSGKYCVKFVAPRDPKSPWPAAILRQLPERDFSIYKYIVVDAFNPMKKKIPVDMYFTLTNGEHIAIYASADGYAQPGPNTIRYKLSGLQFKRAPVAAMQFYQDRPSETRTFYYDNVRLISEDYDVLLGKAKTALAAGLKRLPKIAEFPKLQARLTGLEKTLQLCEAQNTSADTDRRRWIKRVKSIEPKIDKLYRDYLNALARQGVDKFEASLGDKDFGYVWTNGMAKVARGDEKPFVWHTGTLKVELARNEYEGCQIVLRSRKALENVRVSVSDLVGPGRKVLPMKNVKVLPVGYVNTAKASPTWYKVDYRGWHPDPLLDFLPSFKMQANKWQPVWLDVYAPTNQTPGKYRGVVTVTADGGEKLTAPIEVEVWNARIPKEHHLAMLTSLDAWRNDLKVYDKTGKVRSRLMQYKQGKISCDKLTGKARKLYEIERGFQEELLMHRLNPSSIYTWYPERIDEQKRWLASGAKMFNIIYIPSMSHMPIGVGDPCPPAFKKQYLGIIRKRVAELKAAGMLENAYIYCFDEIKERQFVAAKEMLAAVKKEFPDIPIVCLALDPTFGEKSGLADCVDIWIAGIRGYKELLPEIKKSGKTVWPYVCNGPYSPYPNWFIEYSGEEQRLMTGMMAHKYDWGGFLYYTLLGWIDSKDKQVFDVIDRGPLTNNSGRGWGGAVNGDGFIFYPGKNGIMSSIRAKCIRDGLEDFELLWCLRQQVKAVKAGKLKAPAGWLERAQNALVIPETLIRDLNDISRDSLAILAQRRKVAKILSELKTAENPQ